MYKLVIRPILFHFDPEVIHNFTMRALSVLQKIPFGLAITSAIFRSNDKRLAREVFGIKFSSPVGLAAGLDKNAEAFDALGALGFSFVEIGTITPKAQPGNPIPRLFRLPEDKSLINRMGFNNHGAENAIKKLRKRHTKVIIGGNIGKNKLTPNDSAAEDYHICFKALYQYVDYFAINVSSPNTPGLRELQEKEPLTALLSSLQTLNSQKPIRKPILLKIAPDLSDSQLDDIIEIVQQTGIDGVIASNTTIDRPLLFTTKDKIDLIGAGGLSGAALTERSTEVIRYLHSRSGGTFPIIGVGGICSAEDALEKLDAGASLVQLYTGFIYEGPALISQINRAILKSLKTISL